MPNSHSVSERAVGIVLTKRRIVSCTTVDLNACVGDWQGKPIGIGTEHAHRVMLPWRRSPSQTLQWQAACCGRAKTSKNMCQLTNRIVYGNDMLYGCQFCQPLSRVSARFRTNSRPAAGEPHSAQQRSEFGVKVGEHGKTLAGAC